MSVTDRIAKKRALLSPDKQALLEKRLRGGDTSVRGVEDRFRRAIVIPVVSSWKPQGPLAIDWATLSVAGFRQSTEIPAQALRQNLTGLSPALNEVCRNFVCRAFRRMGVFTQAMESYSVERL